MKKKKKKGRESKVNEVSAKTSNEIISLILNDVRDKSLCVRRVR